MSKQQQTARRFWLLAGIAGVLACGAMVIAPQWVRVGDEVVAAPSAPVLVTGVLETAAAAPSVERAALQWGPAVRAPVPRESGLTIATVEQAGPAVAGAELAVMPPGQRWVSAATPRKTLGTSDEQGVLFVAADRLERELGNDRLVVRCPGYRSIEVPPAELTAALAAGHKTLRVTLARGIRQDFLFVTDRGQPLPGVIVWMSRIAVGSGGLGAPEDLPEFADYVEAGVDRDGLHVAQSGADGIASLGSLAPASYAFEVRLPHPYGVLDWDNSARRDHHKIEVPSPVRRIEVAPLWGSVIKVEGDQVVNAQGVIRSVSGGIGNQAFRQARAWAVDRWSTTAATFVLPSDRQPTPEVEWFIMLERTGWHRLEDKARPLDDAFAPTVFRVPEDAPVLSYGTLAFRVATEQGVLGPENLPLFVLGDDQARQHDMPEPAVSERPRGRTMKRLESGGEYRLPAGNYRIQVNDRLLVHLLPSLSVTITANERVEKEVRIPRGLQPCRIDAHYPSGSPNTIFSVRSTCQGKELFQIADRGYAAMLLPVGDLELVVRSPGCLPIRQTFSIVEANVPQLLRVQMEWEP